MARVKFRNPHAVNARARHAGYHNSEKRTKQRVDYLEEMLELEEPVEPSCEERSPATK